VSPVLVLCYHGVSPDWDDALAVHPEALERQLTRLVDAGWRGITFSEAAGSISASAGGPWRRVAVTFDDAMRSVLELAAPILDRLGLPATVFAPTDHVDSGRRLDWDGVSQWLDTPHGAELDPLGWPELTGLADRGWEIGSHTCSHPRLTQLGDDALADELARSRQRCEAALGRPCPTIAYPYGDLDERVARAAGAAGYSAGAALSRSLADLGPLRVPRTGIYRADTPWRFRVKVSAPVRLLRTRLPA
jgi:peptidoglycan/xylan/chitin deacetylase (PgdA/CDA1 family)